MTAFNEEKYIASSITSILNQSLRDFELIIVDDASTDATPTVIKEFHTKDKRIRPIFNQTNLGLTKSLNIALSSARGLYIARMDADDISKPHRFREQVKFLRNHPGYDLVGTWAIIIDENNRTVGEFRPPTSNRDIRQRFPVKNAFVHSSVMFTAQSIHYAGGYDEAFRFAQDYEMWCRLLLFHKGANIDKPLHCWRKLQEGISYKNKYPQTIFSDAVRGRYGPLYRTLSNPRLPRWDKNAFVYGVMLENAGFNGNEPLCRFIYDKVMASRMPERKKLAVLNRARGNTSMITSKVKIKLLEKIKRKNRLENYQLASLYKSEGKHRKAEGIFVKLTASGDNDIKSGAYFHLGELRLRDGKEKEAATSFRKVLTYNPNHGKAREYLDGMKN